jgi:hypothetical protein
MQFYFRAKGNDRDMDFDLAVLRVTKCLQHILDSCIEVLNFCTVHTPADIQQQDYRQGLCIWHREFGWIKSCQLRFLLFGCQFVVEVEFVAIEVEGWGANFARVLLAS